MKTKIILMLVLFIGLFFSTNPTNAQCPLEESCLPDCYDDPWSVPPIVKPYVVAIGCTLIVTYSHRFACNEFYDYYIHGVELIGTCSFGTDIDEVLDAATIALISDNPQNFPATDCSDDLWRASKAVCWREDGGCYTPCPPVLCDLELYRICDGVLTQITNWIPDSNCTQPCESIDPLSE